MINSLHTTWTYDVLSLSEYMLAASGRRGTLNVNISYAYHTGRNAHYTQHIHENGIGLNEYVFIGNLYLLLKQYLTCDI